MRLLLGEPGSGKTTAILREVRRHLRASRADFRLIVPTATMAEHLRNSLAREGLLVRGSAITTIAGFVESLHPPQRLASSTAVTLFLRQILADGHPRAFAALAGSPGFASAMASALEDLANAGCDALQWAALRGLGVHSGPFSQGLQEVYEQLEDRLNANGLVFRAHQLASTARVIRDNGIGSIQALYFDGFFSFTRSELELMRALKPHADLTVALPEWTGASASRDALRQMGLREQRMTPLRPRPATTLLAAVSREREVEEIALRVMELHAAGRPWRDMGVVVRSAHPYVPMLETVCARLGVPLRSYFVSPLSGHPVCRFITLLIDAVLTGWEWRRTVQALRSAVSLSGQEPAADRLELEVREALPGSGLAELADRVSFPTQYLDALAPMTSWASEPAPAADWAARIAGLSVLVASPQPDVDPSKLRVWRARAAALKTLHSTLKELAELLGPEPMLLEGFWRHAQEALSEAALRVADTRRDAVHLLDVYEARQWELPVVFVCGLLEGDFPRKIAPDPVLSEETRFRLRVNGVPVSNRADRQAEEEFLFQFALTRSTHELVLSWPRNDPEGRPTLRSFALDSIEQEPVPARGLRVTLVAAVAPAPRPALQSAPALAFVSAKHKQHRPTALESYLQCPFQFFAAKTMDLRERPALPHERLDFIAQGIVIHAVISDWHRGLGSLEVLFEKHWNAMLAQRRIPPSHRVELARLLIQRSLRFYEQNARVLPGWKVETERPLRLEIEGLPVVGRADRVDTSEARESIVYDFKFSGASGIKRRLEQLEAGLTVQGGLYLAAVRQEGLEPLGFVYVGLRGDTIYEEFTQHGQVQTLMDQAVQAAGQSILQIASGYIAVQPANPDACRYCAFLHACRIQSAGQADAAVG
ncbi:PD-(D/E)XK nuclease family protein [uncultured Paludibaculum sp.]|uniref:PD-(D/E)XK nuclease family protein n=1 Tax=uncultured Paludibaculum sp. TaxID=1765020 RepID=UPI002AAC0429|nr:PD-(D/E)XK nuclease family protein [uncultured Paludibaculum sp.]